jgi:GNAT superfamily N-acetyltransferase
MLIRDATPDDASAACAVMRASISDPCVADHGNDPAILARWLGNKTPENVAVWTQNAGHSLLVAIEGKRIVTVGSEIIMNYVAPTARFHGVSTFLLAALETRAAERGNARCSLLSTETAHRFYLARGYRERPAGRKVRLAWGISDVQADWRPRVMRGMSPAALRHREIEIRPYRHMV